MFKFFRILAIVYSACAGVARKVVRERARTGKDANEVLLAMQRETLR